MNQVSTKIINVITIQGLNFNLLEVIEGIYTT